METTHHSTTVTSNQGVSLDKGYITSLRGLLKIAQAVCSLITFICAVSVSWFTYHSGDFVIFAGIFFFILTLLQIIFNVTMLYQRLPSVPYIIIGLVYYGVAAVCFIISLIIAALKAPYDGGIAAAAVFSAITAVLYGIDFVLNLLSMRSAGGVHTTTTTTTTTKATTATTTNQPI